MKLEFIKKYAEELAELFRPHCLRVEIAGSIRREMPECNDIELVVIPDKYKMELWLKRAKFFHGFWFKSDGAKMKKFTWKGKKVDLFIASPENWGWIYFIRTGPSDYNVRALNHYRRLYKFPADRDSKGNYIVKASDEGYLLDVSGKRIHTPEEQDVYDLLQCPFKQPINRI